MESNFGITETNEHCGHISFEEQIKMQVGGSSKLHFSYEEIKNTCILFASQNGALYEEFMFVHQSEKLQRHPRLF